MTRAVTPRAIAIALALLIGSALQTTADDGGEYKYREGVMQAIGGHMGAITTIVRRDIHRERLALHARSMVELATIAPLVFPAGSNVGASEALPAIWEDAEAFQLALEEFEASAVAFDQAVASGDDLRTPFRRLGQSCKNCHDDYRE